MPKLKVKVSTVIKHTKGNCLSYQTCLLTISPPPVSSPIKSYSKKTDSKPSPAKAADLEEQSNRAFEKVRESLPDSKAAVKNVEPRQMKTEPVEDESYGENVAPGLVATNSIFSRLFIDWT